MNLDPDIASDQQAGCLPPRERYDLVGHDEAENAFNHAWQSGRIHHAWLITGPKGIGKASFAWRAARRVLGAARDGSYGVLGSHPQDPVCRTLEAAANPDMLVIRRPFDEKRKRWRAEITIEEARKASTFFEKSAGAGGWRVCLVDAADDMNVNSANALLKTLEEPPQRGILFLISHSPGRLPATIRSRCRKLTLSAPDEAVSARWLQEQSGIESEEAARLALARCGNAPGRALALAASGGLPVYESVDRFIASADRSDDASARGLAESVTARAKDGLLPIFFDALSAAIQVQARETAKRSVDPQHWLKAWQELSRLVRDADALYLDPRQSVLAALSLSRRAAQQTKA